MNALHCQQQPITSTVGLTPESQENPHVSGTHRGERSAGKFSRVRCAGAPARASPTTPTYTDLEYIITFSARVTIGQRGPVVSVADNLGFAMSPGRSYPRSLIFGLFISIFLQSFFYLTNSINMYCQLIRVARRAARYYFLSKGKENSYVALAAEEDNYRVASVRGNQHVDTWTLVEGVHTNTIFLLASTYDESNP